jgi:hypothetical protein
MFLYPLLMKGPGERNLPFAAIDRMARSSGMESMAPSTIATLTPPI